MNVNSLAAFLDTPIKSAPIIVAPERDVPGNAAASSLEQTDQNRHLKRNVPHLLHTRLLCCIVILHQNKGNTEHNQCHRHTHRIVKQSVAGLIQPQHNKYDCRQAGHHDLAPVDNDRHAHRDGT